MDSKLFIIVGAKPGCNYLSIRATSKQKWRAYQPEDGAYYYFIPGGKLEWFKKDTWLLFSQPEEMDPAKFLKEHFEGRLRVMNGSPLRFQIANEICNKMHKCNDVSAYHKSLLGPPLSPPQKAKG